MPDFSQAPADIGRHYDDRLPLWETLHDGQVHMWYWYDDDDDASLAEAVHRITDRVANALGPRPGEHLLDAGCGPGGTALRLAKQYGVQITGVTVSEHELRRAQDLAAEQGEADRLRFSYGDYSSLPFPDGHFDAVMAIESLQNAVSLRPVLAEFFRVLRPGGRLVLSDFSLESAAEPHRLDAFMAALKLAELPTLAGWLAHLRRAGFQVEEYTQCGPRVFGRKAKYLREATRHRQQAVTRLGAAEVADLSRKHQGFFVPRPDQIGYVIVAARRP